jgi:tetratricopeptide (TPR) repeat protein
MFLLGTHIDSILEGMKYAKKNDYERAVRYYNKALEFEPKNHEAIIGKGVVFSNQKNYDIAIKEFETALEIQPSDANAIKFLDSCKKKVGVKFNFIKI